MSLFPENAYSTIGETQGLDVAAPHTAYQVRSLRFQYHPLYRGGVGGER
jgi:hypothetical protein